MDTRTRVRRSLAASLLAVPLAVTAWAAPAGAGLIGIPADGVCGDQPGPGDADGAVANAPDGVFIGFTVFNTTGEDQSIAAALSPGGARRFRVGYANTDTSTHDIVVRGDLDGELPPPGMSVKVLRESNGKDVTDKVFGLSGLRLRDVASGNEAPFLVVRIKRISDASTAVDAFITGNYDVASFCGDTVRVGGGAP